MLQADSIRANEEPTVEEVVRVEDVCKEYGEGAAEVRALAGVSLTVPRGEFVSVMGPSGCGKSTLLNLIAGYDDASSGRVIVAGENMASLSERARSDLRARHLGFVVQSFDLLPRLTVMENVLVRLGPLRIRGRRAREMSAAWLDKVGIHEVAWGRYPGQLSGGEQQRVAMARALVAEPKLLLADEPTGNLDSVTGTSILDLLRSLNAERRMSVLMVTHDALAATYGHRTVTMRDGEIVKDVGSVAQDREARLAFIERAREDARAGNG
jgi:putative ABC transport system ATP-binding protein